MRPHLVLRQRVVAGRGAPSPAAPGRPPSAASVRASGSKCAVATTVQGRPRDEARQGVPHAPRGARPAVGQPRDGEVGLGQHRLVLGLRPLARPRRSGPACASRRGPAPGRLEAPGPLVDRPVERLPQHVVPDGDRLAPASSRPRGRGRGCRSRARSRWGRGPRSAGRRPRPRGRRCGGGRAARRRPDAPAAWLRVATTVSCRRSGGSTHSSHSTPAKSTASSALGAASSRASRRRVAPSTANRSASSAMGPCRDRGSVVVMYAPSSRCAEILRVATA